MNRKISEELLPAIEPHLSIQGGSKLKQGPQGKVTVNCFAQELLAALFPSPHSAEEARATMDTNPEEQRQLQDLGNMTGSP